MGVIMGPSFFHEEVDNCLTCGTQIAKFAFEVNNGTCDDCPKLTEIAPQFWKVIHHLAEMGDFDAIRTIQVYG